MEEQRRLEEARLAKEAASAVAKKGKGQIAELEAQKRRSAEIKALKEAKEEDKALDALAKSDVGYRKYSIETATVFFSESRKIREGSSEPIY
ncbi:hypothetical protein RJ639_021123 [Escallonia herrerae]|uniref:RING-type E3 ubiquitin transferase n=1 Tax=Escallonia herrerae TaxID=1293975 RepID=A0AA89AFM6_9ASTE|nr:hypothetical protein RJ639_021123 [Escallonia herrerae]